MQIIKRLQSNYITIVSYLHILLFTYAAISKWIDYDNFIVQLGQSPILSAFAGFISWFVIISELLIVGLLAFPRFQLLGLTASYSLMVAFTAYIYILLNFSDYVPCSCGGILENLTWTQHLLFNTAFVILSAVALVLYPTTVFSKWQSKVMVLLILLLANIGIVAGLYAMSEKITHHHNKFIRRFNHWPAVKKSTLDLQYNSYYFAGQDGKNIYLGNTTAPLLMTVVDTSLQSTKTFHITLHSNPHPLNAAKIKVIGNYIFVVDGRVPFIFRGKVRDWNAAPISGNNDYFSLAEPIDSATIALRIHSRKTGESIMSVFTIGDKNTSQNYPLILQKQFDGVFDTDGTLTNSPEINRSIYTYSYRNQFILFDKNGQVSYRGNTIDTFTHAAIKIAKIKSHNQEKLAAPPIVVNKQTAACNNLLFINSGIMGKFENEVMWTSHASIIDIYDLSKNTYERSFYIYNEDGKKVKSFIVSNDKVYALIAKKLVSYKLGTIITNSYQPTTKKPNNNLLAK